ncbi:MAG: DAK2 domain-containing protein [Defluviitaleaceae bacterium]|nr:DAK2 domain-containing protein [Defluviitaleaceae bacterium]
MDKRKPRIEKIDGAMLRRMIICGSNRLMAHMGRINALNVFPVPDGDTGTNMSFTALAAAREVEKLDTTDICQVAKAAASGALRGGRGNSGVIFSQFFRGFSRGLEGMEAAGTQEIAEALNQANKVAYKAVMRPQEGTMLTVWRHMAEVSTNIAYSTNDLSLFMKEIMAEGYDALKRTPDMLPVLKQAGVVDSGGEGIMVFFEGMALGVRSRNPQIVAEGSNEVEEGPDFSALAAINPDDITFGYCTEFFINVKGFSEKAEGEFKVYMDTIGDSIAVVSDDEIVKVHVHTDHPGAVMEEAMKIGPLSHIKIDNMRFQHHGAVSFLDAKENVDLFAPSATNERRELGVIAISSGKGFKEIFAEIGVDYIIEGGQTMNPSAEEIAKGAALLNADNVIILPNNKNIILAAQQAAELCENSNVAVVESKTLPQGIAAMFNYLPDNGFETNLEEMRAALSDVTTGQITVAVRDTELDGKHVKEGDFIGILEGKIICAHKQLEPAAAELADAMMAGGYDMFTIYTGTDAEFAQTAHIEAHLADNYPGCEVTTAVGGQVVYNYIFSAE